MDKPHGALDRHFQLPQVRRIDSARPFAWLRRGWGDMRDNLPASLSYGLLFAAAGSFILGYASGLPHLFAAAISGFFLVGPVAAAGLYEISRRHDNDEPASFVDSLRGLSTHADHLLYFGAFLAFVLLGWERLSAILFASFYPEDASGLGSFFLGVFLTGASASFVVWYLVIGGTIAAVVFALSAVSVPMLMDRDTDVVTAMVASARAVGVNFGTMALWALIIVVLIAVGFATMAGMIVLLPLLGHASWHAYKDLVE